jgi:hypothetical protein
VRKLSLKKQCEIAVEKRPRIRKLGEGLYKWWKFQFLFFFFFQFEGCLCQEMLKDLAEK